jgi:hypothetical protein
MNPRLVKISKTRYTWNNILGNVKSNPLLYFYPEHVDDIREIILEAEEKGYRVRAVGSGHSFSEAAKGDEFMMDMKWFRNIVRYEAPFVKPPLANNKYVLVDAGTTIKRTNRKLDELGLALMNMGAVDFQTVSGALMTGTHGSGIKMPAFPEMVRSLRLVGRNAELIQIEPADGITDPIAHQQHSNIRLIQDDDIFYSTVLSFGAMGIVYQIVFEVVPKYWLVESRYLDTWSNVKAQIQDGSFMQKVYQNDFLSFRVNPHEIKGDHLVSIILQNREYDPPPKWKRGMRNLISTVGGDLEFIVEGVIRAANFKPDLTPNKIQTSMKLMKYKRHKDKSYRVLFQGGAAALRYGISSEFAFKADPQLLIEVMEKIFAQTKYLVAYAKLWHPSYIPLRFTQQSTAYLSAANKGETMYIDVPTLYGVLGYEDLLESYQEHLIPMGGVPHWGKMNKVLYQRHDVIQMAFPKYQKWINVRRQMDPDGTFINDFIIKMGLK